MGKRREGREAAVQFLYQLDLNPEKPDSLLPQFWQLRTGPGNAAVPAKTRAFTEALIRGVTTHSSAIDERIRQCASNYQLERIAPVDRNILRIAIYEMLFCNDVPPVVSINEAIEIAKRFGGDESGRFVNGILDRIRGELQRPARTPVEPSNQP